MTLIKTSLLSFVATVIKLLSGLIINKAISVLVGPSGLAIIGQFQNALGMIRILAQGGLNTGVTKYTAEYSTSEEKCFLLWGSALRLTALFSVVISIALLIGSEYFSKLIFDSEDYSKIIMLLGATLGLSSLNQLFLSILNGLKEVRKFISVNISQSIMSLIITVFLISFYGLYGALVALVLNQVLILFLVLVWLRKHKSVTWILKKSRLSSEHSKKLLNYSLMALVSAIVMPVSMMLIRIYISDVLSWEHAGYWQAMMYISTMYLTVITTALSIYYLPRLSEIKHKFELRSEIMKGYMVIVPVVIFLSCLIFLFKEIIVSVLFSDDFSDMLVLFKWQLLGDVVKIISWLLSYIMIAKAMTKKFIITEVVFSISYVLISVVFLNVFGFVGLSYAFFLNYLLYLMVVTFVVRKQIW